MAISIDTWLEEIKCALQEFYSRRGDQPMTEMVERVAKAIFEKDQETTGRAVNVLIYGQEVITWEFITLPSVSPAAADRYREAARAAIEAMRRPTEAMIRAMYRRNDDNDHEEATIDNWRSAIDAALSEENPND